MTARPDYMVIDQLGGRVVDVHAHYAPETYRRGIAEAAKRLGADYPLVVAAANNHLSDLGRHEAAMDEAGVAISVLSAPPPPSAQVAHAAAERASRINDEMLEAIAGRGDRFAVAVEVPLPDASAAAAELQRVGSDPAVWAAIVSAESEPWTPADNEFEDVYAAAAELGLPVMIHPALFNAWPRAFDDWGIAPSFGAVLGSSLAALRLMLSGMLDRVPALTLLIPHLGGTLPYLAQRFVDLAQGTCERSVLEYLRDRCVLDTCSYHPPALACARDTVGVDRLLLGSDYPFRGSLTRCVQDVSDGDLPEADKELVLRENAQRWLRVPTPSA
jgi:predicted TIM-barrel fold metal-dependent hydrolase